MGKKRAAVGAVTAPVFPFPAAIGEQEPAPDHFSDYGFDPQLIQYFSQRQAERPSTRRHHQQQPPPLESARFKLQKPISKKHHHHQKQQRRRWWSSAASAALLFFKRPSTNPAETSASPCVPPSGTAGPLYLADDDGGSGRDDAATCTCWAPAMWSGHLAAAELDAASMTVPYVSLRDANLGAGAGAAAATAPAMPIYLVT
ncbi:uncharacterized protein LOC133885337 [Phragmites australis]|uniref:uncharacterized protein LOC133885337 n=1 Tax=Phragmites australis TaxID=29695 RepID=UPI002D765F6B|nr:uncharacterized protein LOC133885337 [Phragmites australis]